MIITNIKKTNIGRFLVRIARSIIILYNFIYDGCKYLRYSNTNSFDKSKNSRIATIILSYHIIEKGLTMPKMKLGFGKERLIFLCQKCDVFIDLYGSDEPQVRHAIGVLVEYLKVHEELNFAIDDLVKKMINNLTSRLDQTPICKQKIVTKEAIQEISNLNFYDFAFSRSTLRNYQDKTVDISTINKVIELSQTVPSSCNRQPTKIHVYQDPQQIKDILSLQNGNRGFGEYVRNVMIVSTDLSGFKSKNERNMNYVDGGIYLMNLVYAFHYYQIGSCILNWGVDSKRNNQMHQIANIPSNEVIIAIVTFGYFPDNVLVPISLKKKASQVTFFHN
ncbi:nitroreductase family protein [uncultured Draconibacterium sp.]|uniref:nitroreductase family protein n=1 Tax=uncultured Draconibacterium sp. TaxID=1573823 RepID=UPI0029C8E551|nr:nitroreductase family protein [uncultured Draconibacterium sp.]